mmetsp:Transcript_30635/g.49124  ORF Transcript_30635/g.49124 Transcript_30635/m.49124 type:complete len:409 (-) Transcript_30635:20-1246(-)
MQRIPLSVSAGEVDDIEEDGAMQIKLGSKRLPRMSALLRHMGTWFLFVTMGMVIGGDISLQTGMITLENGIALQQAPVPWDPKCDALLGKLDKDGHRIVGSGMCVSHEKTFATRLSETSLNFLVIGDWGRDGMCCQRDTAYEMASAANATNASFVISTGDNFYGSGITEATATQVETSWANVYNYSSLNVTWYSTLGNHDWISNHEAEFEISKLHPNWYQPTRYYNKSFRENGVALDIVFLDTTPMLKSSEGIEADKKFLEDNKLTSDNYIEEQVEFLRKTFSNNDSKAWRLVVGHHPVYTSAAHYEEDHKTLREKLRPALEELKVNAYICGHDHAVEWHKPDDGTVEYFLSGAGSQTRRDMFIEDTGFKFHSGEAGAFASISVTSNHFRVQFIDFHGNILLERQLSK